MLRTAGLLASLEEDVVSGLRRPGLPDRRRVATRPLGRYRGRTCTGKPNGAFLDAPTDTPRLLLWRKRTPLPSIAPVAAPSPQIPQPEMQVAHRQFHPRVRLPLEGADALLGALHGLLSL